MKIMITVVIALFIVSCQPYRPYTPEGQAKSSLFRSKETYTDCLKANPDNSDKCENLKRIYEVDLEAVQTLSGNTKTQLNGASVKIKIASILVDDQDKALKFYTEKIGLIKKDDVPVGEYKWLTLVSPDAPDGMELLLEPNAHKAAKDFQRAIFSDNIPATTLFVDDIQKEYERLKELGVEFTTEPTKMGTVKIAVFNDTCGNLIQLTEQ